MTDIVTDGHNVRPQATTRMDASGYSVELNGIVLQDGMNSMCATELMTRVNAALGHTGARLIYATLDFTAPPGHPNSPHPRAEDQPTIDSLPRLRPMGPDQIREWLTNPEILDKMPRYIGILSGLENWDADELKNLSRFVIVSATDIMSEQESNG